jgi:hypothetical protein
MFVVTSGAIEIKLGRARDRVAEATRVAQAWTKDDPIWIDATEEPDGALAYRVRLRSQPPELLGAVLGDAFHSARSALDHLAWDLVLANGGQPSRNTNFPIFDGPKAQGKVAAALKGASHGVVGKVFALQPWRGGDDLLWLLHELDLIDKHRLLLTVGTINQSVLLGGQEWDAFGDGRKIQIPIVGIRPADQPLLSDGDIVFRVEKAARGSESPLGFSGVANAVVFGPGTPCAGAPVPGRVIEIIDHAEHIIADLRPT